MVLRSGLTAAWALLVLSSSAFAQDSTAKPAQKPAALAGVVSDTAGHPIPGVVVLADGFDKSAVSDDSGRFHLPGLTPGKNGFTIRKIGFTVVSFETTLAENATLVVNIHMHSAQELDPVVVSANAERPSLARTGFYERERKGLGTFMRPEKVDSMASMVATPSQLLREIPGLDRRCGPPLRPGQCSIVSRTPPYCLFLYVDGHYSSADQAIATALDDATTTATVAAIEVYRHPSEVPTEFQAPLLMKQGRGVTGQASCGALVVWTKAKT